METGGDAASPIGPSDAAVTGLAVYIFISLLPDSCSPRAKEYSSERFEIHDARRGRDGESGRGLNESRGECCRSDCGSLSIKEPFPLYH